VLATMRHTNEGLSTRRGWSPRYWMAFHAITFQMGFSALPHEKMVRSIEILGTRVAPIVR
ncbi:MAG TPA: hypothetical protein VFJ56_03640, partial [Nitrospira sp.]|nr:hypothetical protein [Nitrospira sp.]